MSLRFTILGCGSSMGVPRVALGWGDCDPNEPRNRRRRCALLVERIAAPDKVTRVLVDAGPDIREQLIDANIDWIDGVLITHEHADHTHGLDDLRPMFVAHRRRVDVYMGEAAAADLHVRFGYCFRTPAGSNYPPIMADHRLTPGKPVTIDGQGGPIALLPFLQDHGDIVSLGFRFGDVAYSTDLKSLPPESLPAVEGLDVWIVDALRQAPHPSHMNLAESLQWIARIKPKRAILTDMHTDLDYQTLRRTLPDGIEPAYDGLQFEA